MITRPVIGATIRCSWKIKNVVIVLSIMLQTVLREIVLREEREGGRGRGRGRGRMAEDPDR